MFFRICPILLIFICTDLFSQVGGINSYGFLQFPTNTKTAALGGINNSLIDSDPTSGLNNPSLLNPLMHKRAAVNFSPFISNISYSSAAYGFSIPKIGGTSSVGIQYMYYGIANETDASGQKLGSNISANDFAITASHARTLNNFTFGVSAKLVGSQLAYSSSIALMTDMGTTFRHPKKDITVSLLVRNLGFPLKSYGAAFTTSTPFDIQLGTSFKPTHMPFRFSILIHHLHRYNISYDDPNKISSYDLNGQPIRQPVSFADNLARHFVFGGELLLIKGFDIRLGYNHLRRSELQNTLEGGLSGFSLGFMLKIKVLELAYSHAFFHAVGGINSFAMLVQTDQIFVKKIVVKPE